MNNVKLIIVTLINDLNNIDVHLKVFILMNLFLNKVSDFHFTFNDFHYLTSHLFVVDVTTLISYLQLCYHVN